MWPRKWYIVKVWDVAGGGGRYLQKASFGGDHQDVRVAFILHSQELVCWRTAGPELEGCAGSPDFPFVGDVAELVELAIVIGHIISCWKISQSASASSWSIILQDLPKSDLKKKREKILQLRNCRH